MDMNRENLIDEWLAEERAAHIHGWDFSRIDGKFDEERDLPWNYENLIKQHLSPDVKLLDIDTGGGEFLLSLNHPPYNLSATENYPPNIKLCENKLLPLGVDFRKANGFENLRFEDEKFHMVINRHGSFNEHEIWRVLKPQGIFITEQVGADNDRELVSLLLSPPPSPPFPNQRLNFIKNDFLQAGFKIIDAQEVFRPIKFWSVGALVWFARIIQWEFPGFSVEKCLDNLFNAQKLLEKNGVIEGKIHRILLIAQK